MLQQILSLKVSDIDWQALWNAEIPWTSLWNWMWSSVESLGLLSFLLVIGIVYPFTRMLLEMAYRDLD